MINMGNTLLECMFWAIMNLNLPIPMLHVHWIISDYVLMRLPTNKVIIRRNITPVPITPAIIYQVHLLADRDEMPDGLKIKNKTGALLYDSAWIAGVDIDINEFENNDMEDDNSTVTTVNDYELKKIWIQLTQMSTAAINWKRTTKTMT